MSREIQYRIVGKNYHGDVFGEKQGIEKLKNLAGYFTSWGQNHILQRRVVTYTDWSEVTSTKELVENGTH